MVASCINILASADYLNSLWPELGISHGTCLRSEQVPQYTQYSTLLTTLSRLRSTPSPALLQHE